MSLVNLQSTGLELRQVGPVPPLNDAVADASVPIPLEPILFSDESIGTYAILDNGRFNGTLPDLCDAEGLRAVCLFQGQVGRNLADVAPWIVQLLPGSSLTRNLWTHVPGKEAPWHFWNRKPGIYVTGPVSFDEMRTHFRKLSRWKDDDGKAFFLRFWEAAPMLEYFRWVADPKQAAHTWFQTASGERIEYLLPVYGYAYHCLASEQSLSGSPVKARAQTPLSSRDKDALYEGILRDRASYVVWGLHTRNPDALAGRDPEDAIQQAIGTIRKLRAYGVTSGPDVARLVRWELLLGRHVEDFGPDGHVARILRSDLRDSRKVSLIEEQFEAAFSGPAGALVS
ncbi:DUF4123 domain-containing protein [Aestuariibius sp. 2305UL40-4]|uniref:DUF4123 domain-containing protein n=1 Tax=Aestuariibius violaceus TaxID=3234132 RepID=UPI00345EE1E4